MEAVYTAFEGRVAFVMSHYSPLKSMAAERVQQQLKEAEAPHLEEWSGWLRDFAIFTTLTQQITFQFKGNELPAVQHLCAFWEGREGRTLTENWLLFLDMSPLIHEEWSKAVDHGAAPFVKPESAPAESLPEKVRKDPK
jgi:hypothetical protein